MEPDSEFNSNKILVSLLKFDTYVPENIKPKIIDLLPNCETVLTSFESLHNDGFSCTLRMGIKTKEHALAWLKEFQKISCTTYNADKTYSENSQKTVFKKIFHCLHNTKPAAGTKRPHKKHTNCQAKVMINVKNPDMKRSKDAYLKMFPCLISIRYDHNHTTKTEIASGGFDSLIKQKSPSTSECLVCHEVQSMQSSVEVEDTENAVSSAEVSRKAMQENDKLQEIFQSLSKKLLNKPQLYLEPIKIFNSLYNDLKTDSSLISALCTFGKHSRGEMPIIKKEKFTRQYQNKNTISASARRKAVLGGRNVASTGRPAKENSEHGNQRRKRISASKQHPRRKHHVAPHCLPYCVDNNITLGK